MLEGEWDDPFEIESLQCRTARYCSNWCADKKVVQDTEIDTDVCRTLKRRHD
jgi:hypothetical protein